MRAKSAIAALFNALSFLGAETALIRQHGTLVNLGRENQSLRQRIEAESQLAAERERIPKLAVQATTSQAPSNGQLREPLRLRSEVGRLRQENQEAGSIQLTAPCPLILALSPGGSLT